MPHEKLLIKLVAKVEMNKNCKMGKKLANGKIVTSCNERGIIGLVRGY